MLIKAQARLSLSLLITGLIFLSKGVFAQTVKHDFKIQGIVADSTTKIPLDFLTVSLLSAKDSVLKYESTKADGSFSFSNLIPAKYHIRVQGIGFITKAVAADSESGDLGTIYISKANKALKEVTVTERRQLIKQEADRITYDLQADPESKVSSVLDMMRKVPYLSVDGNDNIMLQGSASYKIFINGKPSGMVERNPKDILRSMPASTIKSIQVITNPSSKYDAEGLAGIINIITVQQADNGYHGSVNLSEKGPVGGPGAGGTFTLKQRKLGLSVLAGGNSYNTPQTTGLNTRVTTGSDATSLDQNSNQKSNSRNGYGGMELSYELDSLNLISAQFNLNGNKLTGLSDQNTFLNGTSGILQRYSLLNDNSSRGNGTDAAFNYQVGFKANKEQTLTFSYRYMNYGNDLFNDIAISNVLNYTNPDYKQSNSESLSEHTVQVDYIQPFKQIILEAGLKGIFRNNKSDFQYNVLNSATGLFEPDNTRSNVFSNKQDVFAAYNTYSYNLKSWQFKAGVRVEQTVINGDFSQGSTEINQRYLNILPSVVASKKFEDRSSLSLAFSSRMQRPSITQLNPFVNRSNPSFISSGNPDLRPTTSQLLQLSYFRSGKATLNLSLGYIFFNSVIGQISSYDSLSKVTLTRFENASKGRILKTNIYFNYPFTNNWNISLNADLRHLNFYSRIDGGTLKNSGYMAYVNATSGYSFNKGWRVNVNLTMNSGGVSSAQGKTNGFTATSFSVNKDIVKNKLALSAAVANPFTKYRYINDKLYGTDFIQTTTSQLYFRSFTISLNYRFGKLKSELKKNKRGITNDDLVK